MEWLKSFDPKIASAFIAAVTSIVTWFITTFISVRVKRHNEQKLHEEKLSYEHKLEEQKKIKESISKNKIQLINAAESLNHRLWNFSSNWNEEWHHSKGEEPSYYELSFVYRILKFYWWVFKVDNELVYLDTTLSSNSDMDFIKYLRIFPCIMCQATLFDGLKYNHEHDIDHFFRHNLESMISSVEKNREFPSFQEFEKSYETKEGAFKSLYIFLDGMSPNERRLRWTRISSLHLLIVSFLNGYGYPFQFTNSNKLTTIKESMLLHKDGEVVLGNFSIMLSRIQLSDNTDVRGMLNASITEYMYKNRSISVNQNKHNQTSHGTT